MMNRKMEEEHNTAKFMEEVRVQVENFKSYRNYFLSLKDYLLSNFRGKYVAIGEGGLLDSDSDERNLQKKIYEGHGKIQVFIEKDEEERFQKELPEIIFDENILAV